MPTPRTEARPRPIRLPIVLTAEYIGFIRRSIQPGKTPQEFDLATEQHTGVVLGIAMACIRISKRQRKSPRRF